MEPLRKHYLFAGLDDSQFTALLRHTQVRDLAANEMLFEQGDIAGAFFLVTRGALMLYRSSADGHEKVMRLIQAGQSCAESIMFMDAPRYLVHARASQPSQIIAIEAAAYLEVMRDSFDTCCSVFAQLTQRIQAHWDEIEGLSLQNSQYRVVHYLLRLAPAASQTATTVQLPMRKAMIAAQLALTPETLSRVLTTLDRNGLIDMHGYDVHIPNIEALRRQI